MTSINIVVFVRYTFYPPTSTCVHVLCGVHVHVCIMIMCVCVCVSVCLLLCDVSGSGEGFTQFSHDDGSSP